MSAGKGAAKLRLVLASTSVHRKQLLERLGVPFTVAAPNVDESPLPGESAADLVGRLARSKAEVVARRHTHSLVVGSDQLATEASRSTGRELRPDRAVGTPPARILGGCRHHERVRKRRSPNSSV